jgi:hypothetical protein
MNNFEKNKSTISDELEKKKEIRYFLIKEKMRILNPIVYSIYLFMIIVTIIAFNNINVTILAIVLLGVLLYTIAYVTYFDTPKGNKIEKELRLVQQDILKLEIEKINSEFLEIKNSILSES